MKLDRRSFTALAAAVLVAISAPTFAKAEKVIKLGHIANEQHSWHKGSVKFAEEVARLTEGRIEVQVEKSLLSEANCSTE